LVFQSASSLTVGSPAAPRSVKLINGAKAKMFTGTWVVSINYAGGGVMVGNVIANGVTLSAPANNYSTWCRNSIKRKSYFISVFSNYG
jgi:hypothetical protein